MSFKQTQKYNFLGWHGIVIIKHIKYYNSFYYSRTKLYFKITHLVWYCVLLKLGEMLWCVIATVIDMYFLMVSNENSQQTFGCFYRKSKWCQVLIFYQSSLGPATYNDYKLPIQTCFNRLVTFTSKFSTDNHSHLDMVGY